MINKIHRIYTKIKQEFREQTKQKHINRLRGMPK